MTGIQCNRETNLMSAQQAVPQEPTFVPLQRNARASELSSRSKMTKNFTYVIVGCGDKGGFLKDIARTKEGGVLPLPPDM